MTVHHQNRSPQPNRQADALPAQAVYLQMLLDSFSGELNAYPLDSPAFPLNASNWSSFLEAATILPGMSDTGRQLIERRLGYLPPLCMVHSQEAFLRALLLLQQTGHLSDDDFKSQTDQCIKMVRNIDMQMPLYGGELDASDAQFCYEQYLSAYAPHARARLTRFLKETPDLAHSLVVELWLRQILARDSYVLPEEETAIDRKAVMLVTYRKVSALNGRQAAIDMPLPAER